MAPAGRKPIGERAMSPAEKQRRYRERLKGRADHKQAYFTINGEAVDEIDRLVKFFGLTSRSELVHGFIRQGLREAVAVKKQTDLSESERRELWTKGWGNTDDR